MSQPHESQRDDFLDNLALSTACHANMSRRGVMKALFALAGSTVLFGSPVRALATPDATKETKEALAAAQAQLDEVQAQMDELSAQFQELAVKQDETISQIEVVQGEIDATQEEIDKQQRALEKKQEMLSDRVAASYKAGGNDMLAILLSSATLDELISNTYYLNKVNERDRQVIEEIVSIKKELEERKAELERQKAELEELKATQAEQLEQMKAKKDEVQALVDGLSEDVKALIAKRDEEILAAVRAEEEARRAAEEARRQQQQSGGASHVTGGSGQAVAGADAQQRVVNSCQVTPSPGYGLCAAWVSYVFNNAGLGWVPGNADDMYNAYCVSSNKDNLRVGMIIAVSSHSHTSAGQLYGHVGVYVGGNTVMDNVGYIRSINLDEWINYYGDTVTPRWGWANGINLEG